MPRRKKTSVYTRAEVARIVRRKVRQAMRLAVQLTVEDTSEWWKEQTKALIGQIVQEDARQWGAAVDALFATALRLHDRNRKRSVDTVGQDAAIAEMRRQSKKSVSIARHFGISERSVRRACRRHKETTTGHN
jgi:hypothetical protein